LRTSIEQVVGMLSEHLSDHRKTWRTSMSPHGTSAAATPHLETVA
jgi:hypothetical protein